MKNITSKDNQKVKDLIRLRDDSKFRNDKSLFYVEGERIVKDTPKNLIDSIYIREDKLNSFKYILDGISDENIFTLSPSVYEKVKDTVSSQGIIAIVKYNISNKIDGNFILVLDGIKDPGNLGTIIRLSEASGVSTLLLSDDCCDIYNTKATRASMSSIFRTNIVVSKNLLSDIILLKNNSYKIISTALREDSIDYKTMNYSNKIAIIIGNEANGVSDDILNASDYKIMINMKGQIESLNASIATSIICFEAMKYQNEN